MERFANRARTNLTNAIDADDTSFVVDSATKFPNQGNFRIRIDDEIILVTAVTNSLFTGTRGQEGTTAVAHPAKSQVIQVLTAEGFTQAVKDTPLSTYSNGTRPDANSVPAGSMIFNTDDNAPNVSDGTNWRDMVGNLT